MTEEELHATLHSAFNSDEFLLFRWVRVCVCLGTAVFFAAWVRSRFLGFWAVAGLQLWMEEGKEHLGLWQKEQGKVVWSWPCSQTRTLGWAVQRWCASCFGLSGHLSPCYIGCYFQRLQGLDLSSAGKNNGIPTSAVKPHIYWTSLILWAALWTCIFSDLVLFFCQVLSELHGM